MSRLLSELLGAKEPGFSLMIKQLEHAAGRPSADVRLSADIINHNNRKIRHLQLDAADTNGPELYHSLLHTVQQHDDLLASALKSNKSADANNLAGVVQYAIKNLNLPNSCWALKPAAAKRLLKSQPPKNVMKQLGYRSIDSMLKREKCAEIFSALYFMESPQWREKFLAKYKQLRPGDFEKRDMEVLVLATEKWGQAAFSYVLSTRRNVLCVRELGVVAILPAPAKQVRGWATIMLSLIFHNMQQIRIFSVQARLVQIRPDFGVQILKAARGDVGPQVTLAGHQLPWPVLQRHLSTAGQSYAHVFEPHVQPEDLHWPSPSKVVVSLNSQLDFWQDSDSLGSAFTDGVVSYNLLDAALNYCNNVPYHKRIVYYMRESLWHELLARYLRVPHIEQDVLKQMEANLTT